jgi:hypothetical protein
MDTLKTCVANLADLFDRQLACCVMLERMAGFRTTSY